MSDVRIQDLLVECPDCGSMCIGGLGYHLSRCYAIESVDEGVVYTAATTEGDVIEETPYSERSPREEWVGAWEVSRAAHR